MPRRAVTTIGCRRPWRRPAAIRRTVRALTGPVRRGGDHGVEELAEVLPFEVGAESRRASAGIGDRRSSGSGRTGAPGRAPPRGRRRVPRNDPGPPTRGGPGSGRRRRGALTRQRAGAAACRRPLRPGRAATLVALGHEVVAGAEHHHGDHGDQPDREAAAATAARRRAGGIGRGLDVERATEDRDLPGQGVAVLAVGVVLEDLPGQGDLDVGRDRVLEQCGVEALGLAAQCVLGARRCR